MLGCDLLPALNEATTATLAQVKNNKEKKQGEFEISRFSKDGHEIGEKRAIHISNASSKEEINLSVGFIADWNKDPETACISVDGNLIGIDENENVRLVLTDTPGPNNSQDENHKLTTMRQIQNTERSPVILYVLNASQLGISDDQGLLGDISKIMKEGGKQSRDRFLFVLNKADVFDPEKGEDLQKVVSRAEEYLCSNGIANPRVYPVSAQFASLLRKRELSPSSLTRSERGDLQKFEDLFIEEASMNLPQYMKLNRSEKLALTNKPYSEALKRSGVPAVEVVINEYITKYNLPHRVSRAHDALKQVILRSSNKENITKSLGVDKEELKLISNHLGVLNSKKSEALISQGFIEGLKDGAIADTVADAVIERSVDALVMAKQIGDTIEGGKVTPREAQALFTGLESKINHLLNNLTIQLEEANSNSQEVVQKDLLNKYQEYIGNIFDSVKDINGLSIPVFDGLKKRIGQMADKAFVLGIKQADIQTHQRQEQRTRMVEKRTWRRLWLWKSEVEETYTVTVTDEEVNVVEVWERFFLEIKIHVDEVTRRAADESKEQANIITQKLLVFMETEFDQAFTDLTTELQEQIDNQALREKSIQEAELNLQIIEDFEHRLFQILSINENGATV